MDKSKIRKSIAKSIKLLAADRNQEIKDIENMIEAWHITLGDLTDEQIANGLKKALSSKEKFMISSGEFRELAMTGEGILSIDEEAADAWGVVLQSLSSISSPVFKNTVIPETIRKMGGWKCLCHGHEKDQPFRRKEFIDIYKIYRKRGGDYRPYLIGEYHDDERSFSYIGFSKEELPLAKTKVLEWREMDENARKLLAR